MRDRGERSDALMDDDDMDDAVHTTITYNYGGFGMACCQKSRKPCMGHANKKKNRKNIRDKSDRLIGPAPDRLYAHVYPKLVEELEGLPFRYDSSLLIHIYPACLRLVDLALLIHMSEAMHEAVAKCRCSADVRAMRTR